MKRLLPLLRRALAVSLLASAACRPSPALTPVAPSAVPATYAVRLHRPFKAGDRGQVSVVVRSTHRTVLTEADQIVKREEEDREVDLKGTLTMIRVGAAGEPLDLEYTIESLILQTPAGRTEVLGRGRVVTAERGKEKVTFHSAEPLSPEAEKAMGEIVTPRSSGSTDDDVFGTAEPQAVGGIWPVNAALAAQELGDLHVAIPADAVHGQTQLVGIVEAAGQTCLDIAGELTLRDLRLVDVPNARSQTGEMRATFHRILPVDPAAPEIDSTMTMHLDLTTVLAVSPEREIKMTATRHQEKRRRYTPLR